MKYSFIIPVYNGERYLRRCLDSVLSQTVQDYEVIIVDDGSTDSSAAMCDEYAKKHANVQVLHTANGGVSRARNIGIEKSTGEYLAFVDCDDEVSSVMLETAQGCNADSDLIIFGYTRESEQALEKTLRTATQTDCDVKKLAEKTIYDNGTLLPEINCSTVWSKLIKSDIIKKNGCLFSPELKIGEDKIFIFELCGFIKSACYIPEVLYYCRTHTGSVMYSYADGYFALGLRSFEILFSLIERESDSAQKQRYLDLCAQRMVLIVKNAVVLDWCHRDNKKSFSVRQAELEKNINTGMAKQLLDKCDRTQLRSGDAFLLWLYRRRFHAIDKAVKNKYFKGVLFIIYKAFNRGK